MRMKINFTHLTELQLRSGHIYQGQPRSKIKRTKPKSIWTSGTMNVTHDNPFNNGVMTQFYILNCAHTEPVDVMEANSIPHSLPQAAPISRDGMKTPADTARPYVQHARKK